MSVVVVIPSRGRPRRALEAVQALQEHAALVATSIVLAIDESDPEWASYQALRFATSGHAAPEVSVVSLRDDETGDLVRATNTVSMRIAREDSHCIIGNLGDDHVCRTPGWDRLVSEALATPGIAYGDDLLQGQALPTAPFISAEVVNALGWYMLPSLRHMYVDDVWRRLGEQLGILRFLPDLVIEHVHPGAGKADWDAGYLAAEELVLRDRDAYNVWWRTMARFDIANVRDALGVVA